MAFRSKLARANMWCCDQVMPVSVVPVCTISTSPPKPFCEVTYNPEPYPVECQPYCPPPIYMPAVDPDALPPYQIQPYPPDFTQPSGIILLNTTDSVPDGYLLCDGSAVSRETYQILFGATGTAYGEGDGSTTFNVPNLINEDYPEAKYIIKT